MSEVQFLLIAVDTAAKAVLAVCAVIAVNRYLKR